MIGRLHERLVAGRRVDVLAGHVAGLVPPGATVLDVGCGDGHLGASLRRLRPDTRVIGVDVLVRSGTRIPALRFDGHTIPLRDDSVDVATLIDVIHHLEDQRSLLREVGRVCRDFVIIKDHQLVGPLAGATLRLMDWIGNARFGVALPYNYLSPGEWESLFADVGLREDRRIEELKLYPGPAARVFERELHFIARLEIDGGRG